MHFIAVVPMSIPNVAGKSERLQLLLDKSELQAIEDFRFRQRFSTRAAAIRFLVKRGLENPLDNSRRSTEGKAPEVLA
jgi:hypothetical protein